MAALLIFIFGLVIGSFLNVLIYRLPQPGISGISKCRSIVAGRSKCPHCQKNIPWFDNIPVLSFVFLKGRCRKCGSKISFYYPVVELLTGFLFFLSFLVYPATLSPATLSSGVSSWVYPANIFFLIYVLFLISILIAIAFIDLKHFIIPDCLILAGFLVSSLFIFLVPSPLSLISHFYGLLFLGGFFLFLFLVSRGRWVGFGDVKYGALLGFVFGPENAVNIFYLTFLIGFIIAIILLSLKKAGLKTRVPLGTLMSMAAVFFLLSGFNLLDLIDGGLILRLWYGT